MGDYTGFRGKVILKDEFIPVINDLVKKGSKIEDYKDLAKKISTI